MRLSPPMRPMSPRRWLGHGHGRATKEMKESMVKQRRPVRPGGAVAIVIGGSMAGLLAARILADFYGEVVILERDACPDEVKARKGVPQGQHAHGLLAKGQQILEELFPGL